MARTLRDSQLDSRAARRKLVARGKPYYRSIETGLHLGYRRSAKSAGKWVARHYIGSQQYELETLGIADDSTDADGIKVLSFPQAQALARERMSQRALSASGKSRGPLLVRDALQSYVEYLDANRKSGREARYAADAFILPALGSKEVAQLTTDQLRDWHHGLTKAAARIRTKPGTEQRFKADAGDPEQARRRKSTANRILTVLKAALNRAWRDGKVQSDAAWRRVEPFEGADAARVRYLTMKEAQRLLNASAIDFRTLVRGALETGARYGELCAMLVSDFNPDSNTLAVRVSKSGRPRHIVLTDDGAAFLQMLAVGRPGAEPLFRKVNGQAWQPSHQAEPMAAANVAAKIDPPINFHGLRHTWASHAIMNGVPMMIVAKNLGHSDTRMVEKHYGHLAPSFVADAIRAGAPRFGVPSATNVMAIGGER